MTDTNQDDEFYVNNDRVLKFMLTDDDNSGDPLNLTGFTIVWAMSSISRKGIVSSTAVLEKKTGGEGIVITDAAGGLCEVTIDKADTASLAPNAYHHELEVIDGSGLCVVNAVGTLTLLLNVVNTL